MDWTAEVDEESGQRTVREQWCGARFICAWFGLVLWAPVSVAEARDRIVDREFNMGFEFLLDFRGFLDFDRF